MSERFICGYFFYNKSRKSRLISPGVMIRVKAQEEKWALSDKDGVKGEGDMIDSFQCLIQTGH